APARAAAVQRRAADPERPRRGARRDADGVREGVDAPGPLRSPSSLLQLDLSDPAQRSAQPAPETAAGSAEPGPARPRGHSGGRTGSGAGEVPGERRGARADAGPAGRRAAAALARPELRR